MNTIKQLASSRLRYYKSRSILCAVAISLTTCLLLSLLTITLGLLENDRRRYEEEGAYHAAVQELTSEQLEHLTSHLDVKSLTTMLLFASVEQDKINAMLGYGEDPLPGIRQAPLAQGHMPVEENEIAGAPAFFTRLGVEPKLGATVPITFRVMGGPLETREFVICGLSDQKDLKGIDPNSNRLQYSASVSKALADRLTQGLDKRYLALLRVHGQDELSYNQIEQRIQDVAQDAGILEDQLEINKGYLTLVTEPNIEILSFITGVAALILLFSSLVIYSIYYVSVITNVQELGKLKALGAAKRQIKGLLLREGMSLCAFGIPAGLILGYGISLLCPLILSGAYDVPVQFTIFRPAVLLGVIALTLAMVYLSLRRPMRLASRISPIEAIRYQAAGAQKKAVRRGYDQVSLFRLSASNLGRNRKRTAVTMMTIGLSCVLFLAVAGLLSSVSVEDYARASYLPKGDFFLALDYNLDDQVYPENNLDSLQSAETINQELIDRIMAIPGVTKVEAERTALCDMQGLAENPITIESFTREDLPWIKRELINGTLDYDKMVAENGVICTYPSFAKENGLELGQPVRLTLNAGGQSVPFSGPLMAITTNARSRFLVPEDTMRALTGQANLNSGLFIYADPAQADSVSQALKAIEANGAHFRLYSIAEERALSVMLVRLIKYPAYALLGIIGVIGFINLINTMITSIVTRKRELGILQAVGLTDRQLVSMLQWEGAAFTLGSLAIGLTLGNLLGYMLYLWGKTTGFMNVTTYHYPLTETLGIAAALVLGQILLTRYIARLVHRDSLIDRMREQG